MSPVRQSYALPFLIILAALGFRLALLEYPTLVDPTEARYASIAQQMVRSGDWLTPHLPMPEGIVPYLGKPPLHFWLTAAFFELFGMDTWSARFPSFVGALVILAAVFLMARDAYDKTTAVCATLITLSSAMFFFIAGASVIDMTLSATVTAGVVALYFRIVRGWTNWWLVPLAAFFGALGFLTKGPIALVLIFLPFFLWGALRRDFTWIRNTSWVSALIVFIAAATPWFILSEHANPGFLKYFIWNENIARYLFKSYGDKYGSGHVYPRGTSWVMLLVAFLPWTVVLGWRIKTIGIKNTRGLIGSNPKTLFVFCWAITATFFFTFVRQLHALYILPSIPGFAVLTAYLLNHAESQANFQGPRGSLDAAKSGGRVASTVVASIFAITIGAALIFARVNKLTEMTSLNSAFLPVTLLLFSAGYFSSRRIERTLPSALGLTSQVSLSCLCVLVCAAMAGAPFISQKRSAEPLMHRVAALTLHNAKVPTIGIFTENTYSPYWAARATGGYLAREVAVSYLSPDKIAQSDLDFILVKKKEEPPTLRSFYVPLDISGPWQLFQRIAAKPAAP